MATSIVAEVSMQKPKKDMAAISQAQTGELEYDRIAELRAFDETRVGVKGLLDAGVTEVPRIFFHPKGHSEENNNSYDGDKRTLPEHLIIDLDGIGTSATRRREIIDKIKDASEKWGCFLVLNHGVSGSVIEELFGGVKKFFEQDDEVKKPWYTRDMTKKVVYNSNLNLYTLPQANWRDTIMCVMAPNVPTPEDLPATVSKILIKYCEEVKNLGSLLLELLSEGLGLEPNYLKETAGAEGLTVLSHYYPKCPQPELTIGTSKHTDSPFFNVVLQDNIGGLQMLNENRWIDVPPTPGTLVVNIGDLLQSISKDKFKSVEHRVLANKAGPRISVASAFTTKSKPAGRRVDELAKELVSEENEPKEKL